MYDNNIQLIEGLKNKELKAYEELFFRYHGRLVLFANKFTFDLQAAQDIVQDAFLNLWEKSDYLTIQSSPKAYLFQSIKNSCLNYKRHLTIGHSVKDELALKISTAEKLAYSDFNDPYYSLLELEIGRKIEMVIDSMPEKCSQVFKLSRQNNFKNREIAEKLGISEKMVEKHISKALLILRHELSEYIGALLLILLKSL